MVDLRTVISEARQVFSIRRSEIVALREPGLRADVMHAQIEKEIAIVRDVLRLLTHAAPRTQRWDRRDGFAVLVTTIIPAASDAEGFTAALPPPFPGLARETSPFRA